MQSQGRTKQEIDQFKKEAKMKLEVYNQDPTKRENQIIKKQNAQVEYLKNNVTPSNFTQSRMHPRE